MVLRAACVTSSALFSTDLMAIVVAYQSGIHHDIRPFLEFANVPVPSTIGGDYVTIVNKCHATLSVWLATFGMPRLVKLFECIPAMHHLVTSVAICYFDEPLLRLCLNQPARQPGYAKANFLGIAAYTNNAEAVAFLVANTHSTSSVDALEWAAINGNQSMVTQLLDAKTQRRFDIQGCTAKALHGAALNGHHILVRYLIDCKLGDMVSLHHPKLIDACAARGHLTMLQYLHDVGCPATREAMDAAATNGHLAVVRWLHLQRTEGCTYVALAGACQNGHLEVVKFLHRHRASECGHRPFLVQSALEIAAGSGHLEIVMYLHAHRFSDDAINAMDVAAEHGHLHVLQWLYTNRSEGFTTRAADMAARHNHLDVVRWLVSVGPKSHFDHVLERLGLFRRKVCTTRAMDAAAAHGHLDMARWLHEHTTAGCTVAAVDQAASRGHLAVVQWLLANRREGGTTAAMDLAAGNGHLEVVQWLHSNKSTPGCTSRAMDYACRGGFLDVAKWLHANRTEGCSENALMFAARHGHVDVVQWLLANRRSGACDGCARRIARTCGIDHDGRMSTRKHCNGDHTVTSSQHNSASKLDHGIDAMCSAVAALVKMCFC